VRKTISNSEFVCETDTQSERDRKKENERARERDKQICGPHSRIFIVISLHLLLYLASFVNMLAIALSLCLYPPVRLPPSRLCICVASPSASPGALHTPTTVKTATPLTAPETTLGVLETGAPSAPSTALTAAPCVCIHREIHCLGFDFGLVCLAVCCSVLQCVVVCYSVLHCIEVCCSVLHVGPCR